MKLHAVCALALAGIILALPLSAAIAQSASATTVITVIVLDQSRIAGQVQATDPIVKAMDIGPQMIGQLKDADEVGTAAPQYTYYQRL